MPDQNNLPTDTEINVNDLPGVSAKTNKSVDLFKLIIFVILSVLIGFLIGGISGILNSKKTTKIQTYKITKPVNIFPIDISVLQNPMFSEWSGRLKGRIKDLKPNSFSISQIKEDFRPDGQIIVSDTSNPNLTEIEITENTKFYRSSYGTPSGKNPVQISFADLKIGDITEGTVKIKYENSIYKLTGVTLTLR